MQTELFAATAADLTSGPILGSHRRRMEALLRHFHRGGGHARDMRGQEASGPQGRDAQALRSPPGAGVPGLCAAGAQAEEGKAGEEIEGA